MSVDNFNTKVMIKFEVLKNDDNFFKNIFELKSLKITETFN